jgi:prophage DNA circulation protein
MSGLLSDVADFVGLGDELALLRDVLGLTGLKPASFRGIPFHAEQAESGSGRRVVVHEFPLTDETQTEDLGRKSREISLTGYVLGPGWAARRDYLLRALEDVEKPGTLVLPGGQEFAARCTSVRVSQSREGLNFVTFTMDFVEAGEVQSSLKPRNDTAALLRASIGRGLVLVREAFSLTYAVKNQGDFARGLALGQLSALADAMADAWLGLPGLNLLRTTATIRALKSKPDVEAPLDQVLAPSRALADAALELPRRRAVQDGVAATTSRAAPPPSRAESALALLAIANAPAPAVVLQPGVVAARIEANRVALDALSRSAAALMAAELLSQTDFATAADALRARDALLLALEAQAEAAALAAQDDLWRAWQDLRATAARDLAERARRAPQLARYAVPQSLPSLGLAQRLYQDGAQADALVALNDAPHPAFMAASGLVLRP